MENADKLANTSDQRPQWPKEEINTPQGPVLFGIYGTVDCYLVRVGANNWSNLFLVVGFVLPNFMENFWLDRLRNPLEACHRPGNLLSLKMKIPELSSDGSVVGMVLSDTRTTSADLCFVFLDLSCLLGRIPRLLCPVSSVFWKRVHLSFLAKSSWCHGAFPYTAFITSPFRTYPTVSTLGLEVLGVWELACNLEDYLYLHFPEDFEVQIKVLWFLPLVTESTLHAYQSNVVLKGSLKQITVAFEATWQNDPQTPAGFLVLS